MDVLNRISELTGVPVAGAEKQAVAVTPSPVTYLCCTICGGIHELIGGQVPDVCPLCKEPARQWPGKTAEDAKNRRDMFTRVQSPTQSKTVTPEKVEAMSVEPAPAPAVPAPAVPAPAPVVPAPVAKPKIDYTAIRQSFVTAHQLNELNWKRVGRGVVSAIGFTTWSDDDNGKRVPIHVLMEATDTPDSFRARYEAAQRSDPSVRISAVRMSGLSSGLKPVSFRGEITGTSDMGNGAQRLPVETDVDIFAKLSKTGSIIWAASKPQGASK